MKLDNRRTSIHNSATNARVQGSLSPSTNDHSDDFEGLRNGPPTDSGYESTTRDKFEQAQNVRSEGQTQIAQDFQRPITMDTKEIASDDTITEYSYASTLPVWKFQGYIWELADGLVNYVRSSQCDALAIERMFRILPELLKTFSLKIGHNAPTQMHRDVMFFIHKYRK
jgi:hypothetical protein